MGSRRLFLSAFDFDPGGGALFLGGEVFEKVFVGAGQVSMGRFGDFIALGEVIIGLGDGGEKGAAVELEGHDFGTVNEFQKGSDFGVGLGRAGEGNTFNADEGALFGNHIIEVVGMSFEEHLDVVGGA